MANLLTAARLLMVVPVGVAFARPDVMAPGVLAVLLGGAIATDYLDGRIARMTNSASPTGQLFDHATDFLFVTSGLAGAAVRGSVTPVLPALIVVAFGQYVLDSYLMYRRKDLRMSAIGRANGVLYFVPLVLISVARLAPARGVAPILTLTAAILAYALVVTTVVSIVDRGLAPLRDPARPRPSRSVNRS